MQDTELEDEQDPLEDEQNPLEDEQLSQKLQETEPDDEDPLEDDPESEEHLVQLELRDLSEL